MIRFFATTFAALAGLAFGSFLNVCLSRWPAGESIIQPRSHCRSCNRTLTWWENIPLVSWLALRGRCRTCKTWIGWRYPLVELTLSMLWGALCSRFLEDVSEHRELLCHSLVAVLVSAILFWFLVALAVLDAENLWLPNFLTYPGILLGLVFAIANQELLWPLDTHNLGPRIFTGRLIVTVLDGLIAALVAAALILAIRWLYWLIRRREGLGLGDAKLMALLAAWLGLPGALLAFVLGVVLGAIVALVLLARAQRNHSEESAAQIKLPLGTFLCIGGIVSSLWGQQILAAYLHYASF
ncbi:MAG TPA: prepilin peptidase [Terracidiphilus sp.]|jgi:leader peptidase (prepilin peptidase)/N-methyltransferase|nr:prepilin peptidase [Terracidiphilus sp.]